MELNIQPGFRLVANDSDITATIEKRFISLRLTDETGVTSDMMEITLADDPDDPIALPSTGAELELFLGYDDQLTRMGMFSCDEIEMRGWPCEMIIRARGAIFDKTPKGKANLQSQKTRSWPSGTTIGAMAAKIAKEHGMESAVSASLKSVSLPHIDQHDESDLNLLVRIGKKYDAIVKPSDGKLVLAKRGESKSVTGQKLEDITLTPDSGITSFHVLLTKREGAGTVIAYYHENKRAKRHEVKVGKGEPVVRLKQYQPKKAMALALANAELAKRNRQKGTLSLAMPGRPDFGAEGNLTLEGFREGVDGEWIITRVNHDLTKDGGYSCSIEAETPNSADKSAEDTEDPAVVEDEEP